MKPTQAQLQYLKNAAAVMHAGAGRGNYFAIWGPGHTNAARACKKRGWIASVWRRESICFITPAGLAAIGERP